MSPLLDYTKVILQAEALVRRDVPPSREELRWLVETVIKLAQYALRIQERR